MLNGIFGGGSERRGEFPSMQETLDALNGDKLIFEAAKKRAQETGLPQRFTINEFTFETRYEEGAHITSPVLPEN